MLLSVSISSRENGEGTHCRCTQGNSAKSTATAQITKGAETPTMTFHAIDVDAATMMVDSKALRMKGREKNNWMETFDGSGWSAGDFH